MNGTVGILGDAFVSRTANVNGTTLHYARGGRGPAVILLHGFPQDWSVFRRIMPRLARAFTVVAVDLRGIGGSTPAPNVYDAATLAEDIHQLARHLALEKPYIAGHDNGGTVAYALARLHPEAPRGVMILDVPIPGSPGMGQSRGPCVAVPSVLHGPHRAGNVEI
jgi:pimeloyl-ACP methyl ester carboxylesterase